MKIGDTVYVHGYVDEIRHLGNDITQVIIRNNGGYFSTDKDEIITGETEVRRHGMWLASEWLRDDGHPTIMTCSECGSSVIYSSKTQWNYCPTCGASMREAQCK